MSRTRPSHDRTGVRLRLTEGGKAAAASLALADVLLGDAGEPPTLQTSSRLPSRRLPVACQLAARWPTK